MVVRALVEEHGMSQRRACQTSGIARSTLCYRPVARDDSGVITFIQAYMALNPRHGFGLLYDSARHQGKPWGKTVLWRVYCELRLNLPRRGKKRLRLLDQAAQFRGYPLAIRTDQGPEFTSRAFMAWAAARGVRHLLNDGMRPANPPLQPWP